MHTNFVKRAMKLMSIESSFKFYGVFQSCWKTKLRCHIWDLSVYHLKKVIIDSSNCINLSSILIAFLSAMQNKNGGKQILVGVL